MAASGKPFRKSFLAEEELDGIDIDGIGNLEDLPRLIFIDEELGNLKVVVDGGEQLTRNITNEVRRFTSL